MPEPEVTASLAQVKQQRNAALVREQNTTVTNLELVGLVALLVVLLPVVGPVVLVSHWRTRRAIRRAD